jgi:hydrogenase maturation protein HypF
MDGSGNGPDPRRVRLRVTGTVQGVGFRPFVVRLARGLGLAGLVRNDGDGVTVEVEGPAAEVAEFRARLVAELPLPGAIEGVEVLEVPVEGAATFVIAPSQPGARISTSLAPDGHVCADCLRELRDPADRRYRYPFISCTRCGPRYTITRALPYDRASTTMAPFALCDDCRREYEDPADRRFHAQHLACPACGPRVWLAAPGDAPVPAPPEARDPAAPVAAAAARLRDGLVVAIRGIGGFHLAADARRPDAVARLRERKHRDRKPLALMVRDLATAHRLVALTPADEAVLTRAAAPIVLAPRRPEAGLAPGLAPDLQDLGVMLPYSPLHHLLLEEGPDVLVMTSANPAAEPILTDSAAVLATSLADLALLHDREIHLGCDDSVVRATALGPVQVRRARGFVPLSLRADQLPARRVLGMGAELKVALATLQDGELVVGRHLGDLASARTEAAFVDEVERVLRFHRLEPEAVAVDLHPDLFSSQHAIERFGGSVPVVPVQHHHAHLAAALVEHRRPADAEVTGVLLDGLGYGTDGTIWGGEVLAGGYARVERVAWLRPVPQPGGDAAAREPHRMATSYLVAAGCEDPTLPGFDPAVAALCGTPAVSPLCSSAGRLFDAVAALLGVAPDRQGYEGEAAMRLETLAARAAEGSGAYPLPLEDQQLDTRVLLQALLADAASAAVRAARFHHGLAEGLARAALQAGRGTVVLSGGCMVNRLLLGRLVRELRRGGVEVLWPRRLPVTDGGLAAGQAAAAACIIDGGG